MTWTVYILRSKKDKRYYIGCTKSLKERIKQYNSGQNKSTMFRVPFEIVHTERYNTQTEAYEREKQIKKYKGGDAFKKLLGIYP